MASRAIPVADDFYPTSKRRPVLKKGKNRHPSVLFLLPPAPSRLR